MQKEKPILAVCGKGGVGKTVLSALLARALLEAGTKPILLVDADPAGGLVSAIGERAPKTLAGVRESLIAAAQNAEDSEKMRLADQLDYLVLEALIERPGYSLLAMGHSTEKGCFCPANVLLRNAIDLIAEPFTVVLIDAEAGFEQIHRQVTRRVNHVIAVSDGSQRSIDVTNYIAEMVGKDQISVVANRLLNETHVNFPEDCELLGSIPEDETLWQFDRENRSLWDLPLDCAAFKAVQDIARKLGF